MKIVIDIPEEAYKEVCGSYLSLKSKEEMRMAIKHGTPLPKGHGRLIEANTIQSMAWKKAEDCFPEGRYYYGYRAALFEFAKDIDNAPTIIEEDKEDEK